MPEINGKEAVVYKMTGRIDSNNAPKVEAEIAELLKDRGTVPVVLDASELDYISSSGLRLFLSLRKASAAKGGKLQVSNINNDIRQVFMMTGFISLFEII